jgi:hypothetical protein
MSETYQIVSLSIEPRCDNCIFHKRCDWIDKYKVNPCFCWTPSSTWLKQKIESAAFAQLGKFVFPENDLGGKA